MRPIKFRFWDYFGEGDPIKMEYDVKIYEESGNSILDMLAKPDDYKIKVMQFTGFIDEEKKDIYDGDLFDGFGDGYKYFEVRYELGEVVVYNNYGKWGTLKRFFEIAPEYGIKMIVRGNIYENPELLA